MSTINIRPEQSPYHPFRDIVFIDIETVPSFEKFDALPENLQQLWTVKAAQLKLAEDLSAAEAYEDRAGIYAEFGKVVVIAIGIMHFDEDLGYQLKVKSLAHDDEKILLETFCTQLKKPFFKNIRLCGHNGKEFDFPFLCRRILINQLPLPAQLNMAGKKPWENTHVDTMQLWKFGDYKSYTSLNLLAAVFGVPTSKDDIDGSEVSTVYYEEKNLERIAKYCRKDVIVTAQVYFRMQGLPTMPNVQITEV